MSFQAPPAKAHCQHKTQGIKINGRVMHIDVISILILISV